MSKKKHKQRVKENKTRSNQTVKPENPIQFLEKCISNLKKNPDLHILKWDSFLDSSIPPAEFKPKETGDKRKYLIFLNPSFSKSVEFDVF